jgi:hypothetical protein
MYHQLEIDVHAHWDGQPPVYRIYVDQELITERKFRWKSYEFYIKELVSCYLETGIHTIKLENVNKDGRFELDQFIVNSTPVNRYFLSQGDNQVEWRFIIDNQLKSR